MNTTRTFSSAVPLHITVDGRGDDPPAVVTSGDVPPGWTPPRPWSRPPHRPATRKVKPASDTRQYYPLAVESAMRAGWDDPELDVYARLV